MFFRIAQKSTNVRAASVRKFVDSWPFKYSPIWSHCHHWPASLGITQGLRKSPKKKRQDDNLLMEKIAELILTVNVDCPSFFKIVPFPASFFFFSLFFSFQHRFNTIDRKSNLLMTGFKPRYRGVWSNCSSNCATTTALECLPFHGLNIVSFYNEHVFKWAILGIFFV